MMEEIHDSYKEKIFQDTEEEKHTDQLQKKTREKKPDMNKERVRTKIEEINNGIIAKTRPQQE